MMRHESMPGAKGDRVLQNMPRRGEGAEGRGMVSGYGRDVWEEFEARILEYEDDCGVLDCGKGDDDSQWEYLEGRV